jgi:serine protease
VDVRRHFLLSAGIFLAGCSGGGDSGGAQRPTPPPPPSSGISVSGAIEVAEHNAVDSDLNDPLAPYVSNDTAGTAQRVSNPVMIGGYVNRPGMGESGRSHARGDVDDYYRVELAAGQGIHLRVADVEGGDPDLYLWEGTGTTIIDFSLNVDEFESLTVRVAGTYLIQVRAYAGASNYLLSIGQQTVPPRGLVGSMDFVANEVVMQFERSTGGAFDAQSKAQAVGMQMIAGDLEREMLMSVDQLLMLQAVSAKPAVDEADPLELAFSSTSAELREKWLTLLAIKELRKRGDVLYAEPNYMLTPTAVANDEFSSLQWHYPLINLSSSWEMAATRSPIVAVIDTGVLLGHPDLQGQLVQGYDFIRDAFRARDGDGIDADPTDVGDQAFGGSSFHGTHVAGTIGAATNNRIGVAGVAPVARIMPLRVLGLQGGTSYDIAQAVRYAAGLPNDSGRVPSQRADVINLSLGGPGQSAAEQSLYSQARAQGVIVVAAAGNEATSAPSYPASYSGVVSVSSINMRRALSSYSNHGPTIDVAAPGGDQGDFNGDGYPDGVLSTGGDDSSGYTVFVYRFMSGTSMAAPHVAGVAALMKAVNSSLTPDQFDALLASGQLTVDVGAPGRDNLFGYGLIDATKAVRAAMAGSAPAPQPRLSVDPASLNFGISLTAMEVVVNNVGSGTLTVNTPTDDAAWLTIAPRSVNHDGLGAYVVSVDRHNLESGTYSATIAFSSTATTVRIPVIMQVTEKAGVGDAGYHYVLLVDPETGESLYQVEVAAELGRYAYRFIDVEAGVYQIFAGTDFDNDGVICDAGEACGAYLTLDQAATVGVRQSVSELNFDTNFEVVIATGLEAETKGELQHFPRRMR